MGQPGFFDLEHRYEGLDAQGDPLVGQSIGLYGVELGAYVALMTAANDASVRAVVLDSVPACAVRFL